MQFYFPRIIFFKPPVLNPCEAAEVFPSLIVKGNAQRLSFASTRHAATAVIVDKHRSEFERRRFPPISRRQLVVTSTANRTVVTRAYLGKSNHLETIKRVAIASTLTSARRLHIFEQQLYLYFLAAPLTIALFSLEHRSNNKPLTTRQTCVGIGATLDSSRITLPIFCRLAQKLGIIYWTGWTAVVALDGSGNWHCRPRERTFTKSLANARITILMGAKNETEKADGALDDRGRSFECCCILVIQTEPTLLIAGSLFTS